MLEGFKISFKKSSSVHNIYKVIDDDRYIVISKNGDKTITNELSSFKTPGVSYNESFYKYAINNYNDKYFEYLTDIIKPSVMAFIEASKATYGDRFMPIVNVRPEMYTGYNSSATVDYWIFHYGVYDSEDKLLYLTPININHYHTKGDSRVIPTNLNYMILNSLYSKFMTFNK